MTDPRLDLAPLAPGANGDIVLGMLDSIEVVIEAPEARTRTRADQVALYNLVNQTSRLFAHVRLAVPGTAFCDLGPFGNGSLADVLGALHNDLSIPSAQQPLATLHLAWGQSPTSAGFAGDAAGLTYAVGPSHIPLHAATAAPPLGAIASTSFMAAQALGHALKPLGFPCHRTAGFVSNLLNYQGNPAPAVEVPPELGEIALLGCGSVGTSAIYCALLAGISGGPTDLVDGDAFKNRNTFRYPILRIPLSEPKAPWLAELATPRGIDAKAHEGSVHDYLESFDDPPAIALAAVSVDTVNGRRDATDLLARTTLNVGVLGLKLHIARHAFGETGCAYCQYVDVEPALSASAALAEQTGLPIERVVELEISADTLTDADIAAIAAHGRLVNDPPEVGDRLADLRRRVYAQAAITTDAGDVLVAAPFVSTLAGELLLVEALKEAHIALHGYRLDGRYDVDMSGEPTGFTTATSRDRSGRCLCYSPHRQLAYQELHGSE